MPLGVILLFFFLKNSSIWLSPRPLENSQVLNHQSNARYGFYLVKWVLNQIGCLLVPSTGLCHHCTDLSCRQ